VLQYFYDGLTIMSRGHIDTTAGGAFLSLTIGGTMALTNKMVADQSWGLEKKTQKGMHIVKETGMLSAKIDLVMKRLEERAQDKDAMMGTVLAMDSHMMCEVCGNIGHSGNDCPETREEAAFINSGFHQSGNNGWNNQSRPQGNSNYNSNYNSNQPSLKDLVFGQVKINESLTKKLTTNDKILENINSQIEGLTSAVKNQMGFNKMVESQLAKIAAAIPISNDGKIPTQPENSREKVNVVVTRGGKSTRDPPNPNHSVGKAKQHRAAEPSTTQEEKEKEQEVETAPKDFIDTSYLPFPTRNHKQAVDEQFTHFVEMIKKIHVSVPLMDVLHVPSYAKDIINNKRHFSSLGCCRM